MLREQAHGGVGEGVVANHESRQHPTFTSRGAAMASNVYQEPTIADARELRDMVLRNDKIAYTQLETFAAANVKEGLHFDFKSAQLLGKPKAERNAVIRSYVAAFANSDGGTLIIGVREQNDEERKQRRPWKLEPITHELANKVDKAGLQAWVAQVTSDLLAYLGAPPRVQLVEAPDEHGVICLIATPRAQSLVPVLSAGDAAYFFRIEDSTQKVPPSLVADLLLGRRIAPNLFPSAEQRLEARTHVADVRAKTGFVHQCSVLTMTLTFAVENDSLVCADDVSAGLIVPHIFDASATRQPQPLPTSLSSAVDFYERPGSELRAQHYASHVKLMPERGVEMIRQFDVRSCRAASELVVGHLQNDPQMVTACALYLLPRGCPPQWFQVVIEGHGHALKPRQVPSRNSDHSFETLPAQCVVRTHRVIGARPVVSADIPKDLRINRSEAPYDDEVLR
jgi:hypothetical protein